MLTKRNIRFLCAAVVGTVVAAAAVAPARAEGGWLWLESGSIFPIYRQITPAYKTVARINQRPRVMRASAPALRVAASAPGGNFWGSSRIYVAGLSF